MQFINILNLTVGVVYRVPQILKLTTNKSAVGLSFYALVLDMFALLCSIAYNFTLGYSFMSYGEMYMNFFQLFIVFTLVYKYKGMTAKQFQAGVIFTICFLALIFSKVFPIKIVQTLLMCNTISFIVSKLLQIKEILVFQYSRNLSLFTLFISPSGIASRLFTVMMFYRNNTLLVVS